MCSVCMYIVFVHPANSKIQYEVISLRILTRREDNSAKCKIGNLYHRFIFCHRNIKSSKGNEFSLVNYLKETFIEYPGTVIAEVELIDHLIHKVQGNTAMIAVYRMHSDCLCNFCFASNVNFKLVNASQERSKYLIFCCQL